MRISNLSIFPANDVDYFNIVFPQVTALGGRCFSSGFAFDFGTKVNARIFVNGVVAKTYVNTSFFSICQNSFKMSPFALRGKCPLLV